MSSSSDDAGERTINFLNNVTSWGVGTRQAIVTVKSDQILGGSITLSKHNKDDNLKVTLQGKEPFQGQITYQDGLSKSLTVTFYKKLEPGRMTISLHDLDTNSEHNLNKVKLMGTNLKSNNLEKLPDAFPHLYGKDMYEFLIKGCIQSSNWDQIKKEGFVQELDRVMNDLPEHNQIHCYLFTLEGDTSPRNFGIAKINGEKVNDHELKQLAKYIRRMFTGVYESMDEVFQDSDEEFLQKLEKKKDTPVYCEWTLREYTTNKWFFNEIPSCEKFDEVIFSSENGSILNRTFKCQFDPYRKESGWTVPSFPHQSEHAKPESEEAKHLHCLTIIQHPTSTFYNASQRPKHWNELKNIVNKVSSSKDRPDTDTVICEGKKSMVSTQLQKYSSVDVLVWCATGSSLVNNTDEELDQEELQRVMESNNIKPKVMVVCTKVGSEVIAKFFQDKGAVDHVQWISCDVLSDPKVLSGFIPRVILPSVRDLVHHKKFSFQGNMVKFCRSNRSIGWNAESMSGLLQQTHDDPEGVVPELSFKKSSNGVGSISLEMKGGLKEDWISSYKSLRNLKMNLADHDLAQDFKDKVKSSEQGRLPHSFETTTEASFQRAQALVFYAFSQLAVDEHSFQNGYFYASTKKHVEEIRKKLKEDETNGVTDKLLVWFDMHNKSDLDIATLNAAEDWSESVEVIPIITCCPERSSNIKKHLKCDNFPLPENNEKGLEIGYTAHHGVIKITPEDKDAFFQLDEGSDHSTTFDAILQELANDTDIPKDEIKLYLDNDHSLQALITVQNLHQLKSLINACCDRSSTTTREEGLKTTTKGTRTKIQYDVPQLLELFEKIVLQLDVLTDSQMEVIRDCQDQNRNHVTGPAGTGKTFVALDLILQSMKEKSGNGSPPPNVLFVTRNLALSLHFGKWLWRRACKDDDECMKDAIRKIVYLSEDEGSFYRFQFREDKIKKIKVEEEEVLKMKFDHIVVDEAHEVFAPRKQSNIPVSSLLCTLGCSGCIPFCQHFDFGKKSCFELPFKTFPPLQNLPIRLQKASSEVSQMCSSGGPDLTLQNLVLKILNLPHNKDTELLILSDISQAFALKNSLFFPDAKCHKLTEICRSSERLAGAATSYTLVDSKETETSCAHKAPGPPLKTMIFDSGYNKLLNETDSYDSPLNKYFQDKELFEDHYDCLSYKKESETRALFAWLNEKEQEEAISKLQDKTAQDKLRSILDGKPSPRTFQKYAEKVMDAIDDVTSSFDMEYGNLHDRLGIIVPSEEFRDNLFSALEKKMTEKGLKLVTAVEASAILPKDEHSSTKDNNSQTCIVLDTVDNFNGLEKLMVFGVGLDVEIEEGVFSQNNMARSQIYRAITRAHLVFVAINEYIPYGWFAWICSCTLIDNMEGTTDSSSRTSSYFDAAKNVIDSKEANFAIGDGHDDYDKNDREDPRNIKKRNNGFGLGGAFFEAIPSLVWDISKNDKDLPISKRDGALQFSPFVSNYWCVMSLDVVNYDHVSNEQRFKVMFPWYCNELKEEMISVMSADDEQIITYVQIELPSVYIGMRVGDEEDANNKKKQILDRLVDFVKSISYSIDGVHTCLYGGVDCGETANWNSAYGLYKEARVRFENDYPNHKKEVVPLTEAQGKYFALRVDGRKTEE